MRVGFLFNHYATHQVVHAAPYAFELSRRHPEIDVIMAAGSDRELAVAAQMASLYPRHRCRMLRLRPAWWYRPLDPLVSKVAFARKNRIIGDNLDFFRTLDALVAPERHVRLLRTKYGMSALRLIHTRHGAGDRENVTDASMALFDFVLVPGQKYVERFSAQGWLRPGRYAVAGWPKFEVVGALNPERRRFFDNDNPVVVYNPHFDSRTGSWVRLGAQVLDFFVANPNYNLIFAPHVVLFARALRHRGFLPARFHGVPNILVDTGSEALNDMTYLRAADIYLGDVSSQVYEFLVEPRPCVFLDAHGIDWATDPHYAHWRFGPVIRDVASELGPVLGRAVSTHGEYATEQRVAFAHTFHETPGTTAAERGADAIAAFLRGECPGSVQRP